MQVKILKDIVMDVAGQSAIKIVDLLFDKKNVNEFLIAKKLKLTINQTRNILYKLADHGLVSFVRKKDSKKGGWYIYFWTLNVPRSLDLFKEKLARQIDGLENAKERRKNERFYYSKGANIEYTEEEALEHNFVCPETGEVMDLKDNTQDILKIEKEIFDLRESLNAVVKESGELNLKGQQSRDRKARAEIRKKEKERKKKRELVKKEKEKEKKRLLREKAKRALKKRRKNKSKQKKK